MELVQESVRAIRTAALRPALPELRRNVREQEEVIALLAQRFDAGVGLFDGAPLQGPDADDWLRLQFGLAETTQEVEMEQAA